MSKVFFIVAKAKDNTPEVLVYGLIGGDDANSTDFVKAIRELEKTNAKINVRINSDGGSVLHGLAMYAAIINSRAEINTYIDGFAGSMAAVLAMAGKKVFMSKYARLMTHSASGAGNGNADEMRNTAKLLDSLDNTMCVIYANRTGKTAEQCLADYVSRKEDKWFTAEEAMAEKLIDGIYDGDPVQVPVTATASTDMWAFYNEHKFAALFNNAQNKHNNMEFTLSAAAKAALNIGDTADASAFDKAITALAAKANQFDAMKIEKEAAEQKLKDINAAAITASVTTMLTAALGEKKITKATHDTLAIQFKENPDGLKAVLETMQPFESIVKDAPGNKTRLQELVAKSWNDLDKSKGELEELKKLSLDEYKVKFKAQFKKDYTGK